MVFIMKKSKKIKENEFCTLSNLSELTRIREFVHNNAIGRGFSEEQSHKIALAVDEACTNLMKHAYHLDQTHEICLHVDMDKDKFIVDIYDDGVPFNPMEVNMPDMNEYFKSFRKGGLGIQIIRSVMDEIKYYPSDKSNQRNKLTLIKTR
ncbi:MAG: serine/threonine-protein kinase RsbW [Bacteroidota bacterium]|nr:serine/threonine-protein kinase RsbW [Bacteroidota bacterium]